MLLRRAFLQRVSVGSLALMASCSESIRPGALPTSVPARVEPSPEAAPALTSATQAVAAGLDVDLDKMIGQMFLVGFRGLTVAEDHPIVEDIRRRALGGVVLFDYDVPNREFVRNIESPSQVKELTESLQSFAQVPLLIAIDQEGGNVARLNERYGFGATLSHQALGEIDDVETTFEHAREIARTLKSVGVNHNLAPVVDVNVNPESPAIGAYGRSFSSDVEKVIQHAAAFIRAHRAENIITTLKHFPGHGSARNDSHRGFVDVTETWSRLELEPYLALIEGGLADSIMTAHVFNQAWDESDPATLSRPVITGMLREEMGYAGVIISDDMQMEAIRSFYSFEQAIQKSVEAGVDVIAIANNSVYEDGAVSRGVAAIKRLVSDGRIAPARIQESYRRIQNLKARLQ